MWKKRLATTVGIFRLRPPPKNLTMLPDQLKVPTVASFMTISLPSYQTIPVKIGKATKRVSSASSKSSTAYKIRIIAALFSLFGYRVVMVRKCSPCLWMIDVPDAVSKPPIGWFEPF